MLLPPLDHSCENFWGTILLQVFHKKLEVGHDPAVLEFDRKGIEIDYKSNPIERTTMSKKKQQQSKNTFLFRDKGLLEFFLRLEFD